MKIQESIYNDKITLFNRVVDPVANLQTVVRTKLDNVNFADSSVKVWFTTGTLTTNVQVIVIPRYNINGEEYPKQLTNAEWSALPVNASDVSLQRENYTIRITGNLQTLIAKGHHDLEYFPQWGSSATVTTWIDRYLVTGYVNITPLGARNINDVNFAWYGKPKLQHILAR